MKKVNVAPLGENVLIQTGKPEKKTESGLYIPDNASLERSSREGKVAAIGESEKISVKVGQKVIYARYGGTEITIDGDDYVILKGEDILAIVTE